MHIVNVELVGDANVEIAVVFLAGFVLELAGDGVTLFDGQDILEIEDSLFPVRVLCVGAGGKANGLVAGGKLNIEPRDDGVNEVVATDLELVGFPESEVGDGAGVEVEGDDGRGVCDDGLDVDGVDERLRHGCRLERGVIETPDIVPD